MKDIKIDGRKIVMMTCIGIILVFFLFVFYWGARWIYIYTNSPTPDVTQSCIQNCCPYEHREHHKAIITPKSKPAVVTPKPKPVTPKPKPTPVPQQFCKAGTSGIYPNCYYPTPVPQPQPVPQTPIGPPPLSDPTPIYTPTPVIPSQPQPNPSYIGPLPYSNPIPQTGTTYSSDSIGGVPYSDGGGSTSGIGPAPYPSY